MADEKPLDSRHAVLRRACSEQDIVRIKDIISNDPDLLDAFNGLALRISSYHGRMQSLCTLMELGASKPEDLTGVCKRYFFIWNQRVPYN